MPVEKRCRLRNLVLPAELAKFAFCHHWTRRSPSLPEIKENQVALLNERQLDFSLNLEKSIKQDEFSAI